MSKAIIPALLIAFAPLAFGQAGQPAERTIELKDGGKITLAKDGTMVHRDVAGRYVHMRDGEPMQAKDGSTLTMKNKAVDYTPASLYPDRAEKPPVGF